MVCFIILHYMVMEETVGCIRNLLNLEGKKIIIIVDNASSNGTGRKLAEMYEDNNEVYVLLNKKNEGFSRGNNRGCAFAKAKFAPDYYVVMNNDVEIPQADFIDRIIKIWKETGYDVLGPDIYSTSRKVHQSPKSLTRTSIESAKEARNHYQRLLNSHFMVPVRCFLKQIPSIRHAYDQYKNKRRHIDHTREYRNVPLHGSCLIFSKRFIDSRKEAFFPGTFFYYETEILDYECQINNQTVVYSPDIKVYHHQNVSTNTVYRKELDRVRFMNLQNYRSISSFLEAYGNE